MELNKKSKIFIAGHNGMVGSSILNLFKKKKYKNIYTSDRKSLDLLDQKKTIKYLKKIKPKYVIIAAAKVGGILANNDFKADFIYQNLMIQNNVIHSAFLNGVKKLLFLGSSCIYPNNANQPMKEDELLSGKLEPTNEPYAIAKIAGIKMCESYNRQYGKSHSIDYRSIMPTNLYGPGDNYHPENSHVIPGLIYRFHQAKIQNLSSVSIWGTGNSKREFLYVDDMVRASVHIMNIDKKIYEENSSPMTSHINVGSGEDLSIKELAEIIKEVVNFEGEIKFDPTRPDGSRRKFLDSRKINNLNFKSKISLKQGLVKTYQDFTRA